MLGLSTRKSESQNGHAMVVIVSVHKQNLAIAVDNVLGMQQVVLKEMQGIYFSHEVFDGAAIMGDGHVAPVINLENLCEVAKRQDFSCMSRVAEV